MAIFHSYFDITRGSNSCLILILADARHAAHHPAHRGQESRSTVQIAITVRGVQRANPGRTSREIEIPGEIWTYLGKTMPFLWKYQKMFEHPTFFQKSNLSVTRRLRRRLGLNTQVDSEGVGGLSLEMSKNCRKMCIRTLQTVSDGSHNVSPEMLNFGKYRFFFLEVLP